MHTHRHTHKEAHTLDYPLKTNFLDSTDLFTRENCKNWIAKILSKCNTFSAIGKRQ